MIEGDFDWNSGTDFSRMSIIVLRLVLEFLTSCRMRTESCRLNGCCSGAMRAFCCAFLDFQHRDKTFCSVVEKEVAIRIMVKQTYLVFLVYLSRLLMAIVFVERLYWGGSGAAWNNTTCIWERWVFLFSFDDRRDSFEQASVLSLNQDLTILLLLFRFEFSDLLCHVFSVVVIFRRVVDFGANVSDFAKHKELFFVEKALADVALGEYWAAFAKFEYFEILLVLVWNSNVRRHF